MRGKITLAEDSADPPREREANWIMKWFKERSVGEYIGEIAQKPELVLDHAAGRIYQIKTDKDDYFLIIGCGHPVLYPLKKTLNSPEEILSFHRGRGLVTRLKFNHLQNKTRPQSASAHWTESDYHKTLGELFPKVRRMVPRFERIRHEIKRFPCHENFILFVIEQAGKGEAGEISKIVDILDESTESLCKGLGEINRSYHEFIRMAPLTCT
jgi:hypothetical protein